MIIRKANKEDLKQVSQILLEVDKLHEDNRQEIFNEKNMEETEKEVNEYYLDKKSYIYVASNEDNICGMIMFKVKEIRNHKNLQNAKVLWIDDIGVKREMRKKGIGRLLMKKVEERAKENQCSRIELNCWNFNSNAINFYKELGMQTQRRIMEMNLN